MSVKRSLQIALFLLPAFFLLHNYNELPGFIRLGQVLKDACIIYALLLVFYFIMIRSHVSAAKTSLILLCVSVFVLFFGPLNQLFLQFRATHFLSSLYVFFPVFILLLIFIIRKILRSDGLSSTVSLPVLLIMLALMITEGGMLVVNYQHIKKNGNLIYPAKPLSDQYISSNKPDSTKPDIYFFVFDAYTNNEALEKVWHYDNSQITDWLKENDFHITPDTHSNYNFTAFSVSSTFNMNFISSGKGNDASVARNVLQGNNSISDNETFSLLEKEHYDIHFLAPFSNRIKENGLSHFFGYLSDKQIQSQTMPGSLYDSKIWIFLDHRLSGEKGEEFYYKPLKEKYRLIRKTVDMIKETADSTVERKPHFVYGHIMVPHEPPLFDSMGNFITAEASLTATQSNTYINQIRFANKLIREIVSYIRTHNKKNTIIIMEGDHGFGFFPSDSIPAFGFKNFSAIYFPDRNYDKLYPGMSPVNIFRIVFDKYFDQHYPLLKDSSIIVKE